jgi:hypothetical protein
MKPNINSVEVHPQLSNYSHPSDGALVGQNEQQREELEIMGQLWARLILSGTGRPKGPRHS